MKPQKIFFRIINLCLCAIKINRLPSSQTAKYLHRTHLKIHVVETNLRSENQRKTKVAQELRLLNQTSFIIHVPYTIQLINRVINLTITCAWFIAFFYCESEWLVGQAIACR